jgi:tRNA nucleotidyltransferase (CCA-adding enzyme)
MIIGTEHFVIAIPPELERVLAETPELRECYLVGGCVRDALLGVPHKDFDVEVFGLTYENLAKALSKWGRTDLIGRSFGVVKLRLSDELIIDFTIPRRDSKTAPGHKGFHIEFDSGITPKEAASRRDFTINAILYDPRNREVLDFFGGATDLKNRMLRHTSEAFPEDPLRVLRGMQFAGRFGLMAAPETIALSRSISGHYVELARERVREEWFKWAAKSGKPSAGLRFLEASGWIEHFPALAALRNTPQDAEWHPEGDVFEHTCHCCDAMARLPEWRAADEETRIVYQLAVLLHDVGKPGTTFEETRENRLRIVSPGHEKEGVAVGENFLNSFGAPEAIKKRVIPLVANHMAHLQEVTDRSVRRLARRLEPETIRGLAAVMTADSMGRPPRPAKIPETARKLLEKSEELRVHEKAPGAILMGRHLLQLGIPAGPEHGAILRDAYEAQLDGVFHDLSGALLWLKSLKR